MLEMLKLTDTEMQEKEHIMNWHDLWFTQYKSAGYIAITDFQKQLFFGSNDLANVINRTAGRKKQFISLNAFDVDWNNKDFSRQTSRLKQLRVIAIDIDQYNLNLTIDEVLDEIQVMILSNKIPEPNLVLTSRGVQLFYGISRGASPKMSWLSSYITEQLISKLSHLGADSNAKDVSRVMRVPNSINERNNAHVKPYIWNDETYTLQELQAYCRPLEKFKSREKVKAKVINLSTNQKLTQYYKTNHARLRDLSKLLDIRGGDLTGIRNVFLYIYSYHQSLVLNTQKDVVASVSDTFKNVYSTDPKANPISKAEIGRTVRSAYKDAEQFFKHFQSNGYNIVYKANDGIIKPMKTSTLIKRLSISEDEQYHLGSIRNREVDKRQRADRAREKRRSEGMGTIEEYNNSRQQGQLERVQQLINLLEISPNATQRELAEMMDVSAMTISRLKKQIEH